jgi:hypothetical protein
MSAVGIEAQIAEALLTRLAALTLTPVLKVAMPNVSFPAAGTVKPDTYLQASLLRAATQGIGINAWDEHAGILQVDVLYKAQDGEIKPLQIADAVAVWFGRGTRLPNGSIQVDVYEQPSIGPALDNGDGYSKFPVSIRYRSFVH